MITTGIAFAIALGVFAFFIGMGILFQGWPEIHIHKHYKS